MYLLQTGVHTTLVSFYGSVSLGIHENSRFIELIFMKLNTRELKKNGDTFQFHLKSDYKNAQFARRYV
jgi:hypothetical protein